MELRLDKDWQIQPVKGDTGKTYIGRNEQEKIFIKRNTTPMLAALSKEGMTPRLVWTRRTGNGDVLSAQEWLDGRVLTAEEIGQRNDVIDVLYHLHHSKSLNQMLERLGGVVRSPHKLFTEYEKNLPRKLAIHPFLQLVRHYLKKNIPDFQLTNKTVVHGDVNYRNWLVCQNYLYLVDWDSVMFADPAVDLGAILGHYVPLSEWKAWLMSYGKIADNELIEKIYWYALLNLLQEITKNYNKNDFETMNTEILQLKRIFKN